MLLPVAREIASRENYSEARGINTRENSSQHARMFFIVHEMFLVIVIDKYLNLGKAGSIKPNTNRMMIYANLIPTVFSTLMFSILEIETQIYISVVFSTSTTTNAF
ncbi:CLUMA_CG016673, isoform A [Clunio marinus]|uniref:CLUMA_CG016673, isoform A n=1 Tax=Clunio marinus TaxID=568069 RepID=A0A1J1IT96_9DIPT|nr:CLUMA_CG016673, isoform A [Clunio marinus]